MRTSSVVVVIAALMAVVGVVVPRRASANAAAPWSGGQIAGEASGIRDVAITREELVIDLRPLAEPPGLVEVSASYALSNRGVAQSLDLVFASGAAALKDFRVHLDGRAIDTRVDHDATLPQAWKPPRNTPRPGSATPLGFELDPHADASPMAFRVDVTPGPHSLVVTYRAAAMFHRVGDPTVVRQFAYVLAPAREWASFDRLDVTVRVPAGWAAASEPPLTRVGPDLVGTFSNVPADALALAVQVPAPAFLPTRIALLVLVALVVILGGVSLVRAARKRPRSFVRALGLATMWTAAFVTAGVAAILVPRMTVPTAHADHGGYGVIAGLFLLVLGAVLLFALGVVLALVRGRPRPG
jgi:hypothetical protein